MQNPRMRREKKPALDEPFFIIVRILFAVCIFAGCYSLALNAKQASYSTLQKRTDQLYAELGKDRSLIQSFQADRAHLTAIVFYASRLKTTPSGNLVVRLRHPGASKDLAVGQFYLAVLNQQEMLTFNFPALERSEGSLYELVFETSLPPSSIGLWGSTDDAYALGTLTQTGAALPFDLSFLTYYRSPIFSILNTENAQFFFWMLLILLFYLICGWIVWFLVGFPASTNALEFLAALVFLPLAFVPIVFALMSLTSFKINPANLILIFTTLMILSFLVFLSRWKILGYKLQLPNIPLSRDWFFWCVLVLLFYALFARAAQAHGLYVPNWMDGLVHQRSLDKILETGSQPAGQIYHAGFYAPVLLTSMLTGLPTPQAMLVCGQLFSALSGFSFLILASRFFSSRMAILLSAVVYWFLVPFPSYLLTWSRFPFLLGLTLLPILLVYTQNFLRAARLSLLVPVALLFTGLLLVHYGVAFIFLVFLPVLVLFDPAARSGFLILSKRLGWWLLPVSLAVLAPTLVFIGPKLVHFLFDSDSRQMLVTLSQEAALQIDLLHIFNLTTQNGGMLVWGMAAVGFVFGLAHARKSVFLLLTWCLALWLATWLQIQLWGIAVSGYANLLIFLSIPLSILSGFAVEILFAPTPLLVRFFEKLRIRPASIVAPALLMIVLSGSYRQLGTVNPVSVLFSDRDRKAVEWIQANTPSNALILVNSFRWGDTYWPSDGGGWLKSFTGRRLIYARSADELAEIDALVSSEKIQFVYLGQGYGELSINHFFKKLTYQPVYEADGVRIFAVKGRLED